MFSGAKLAPGIFTFDKRHGYGVTRVSRNQPLTTAGRLDDSHGPGAIVRPPFEVVNFHRLSRTTSKVAHATGMVFRPARR